MRKKILLDHLQKDADGIFGGTIFAESQATELKLRENVATAVYSDYLLEISKHHSIEVMDREVKIFIEKIPKNGVICDVGGCWGWHWRNIHHLRPDIMIVIVDFCKSNLLHAKKILDDRIGENIWLVHGDAKKLDFDTETFDGYWTVQTLQHIPEFDKAIAEAFRVLKIGGVFANYSLNNSFFSSVIYKIFGKSYVTNDFVPNKFFLRRADNQQRDCIREIFCNEVVNRYSEFLFKPEFGIDFMGRLGSTIGKLDALLSGGRPILSMARQHSFHTVKQHVNAVNNFLHLK